MRAVIREDLRGEESSVGESSPSRNGNGGDGPPASARHDADGGWWRAEPPPLRADMPAASAAGDEKPSTSTQPFINDDLRGRCEGDEREMRGRWEREMRGR